VSCLGSGVFSHCPSSSQSRRTAASHLSVMGPIQWACPQATRSFVQGCTNAMTPHPVGRDAHVSDPSRHAAETSMACGQRRMVGRSSSITDRLWSAAQAAQTMTVNGRSVPRRGEVNAPGKTSSPLFAGWRDAYDYAYGCAYGLREQQRLT
jgi:hypothetical protein